MNIISRNHAKLLGLKRYFTGKKCLHGHVCERQTSNKTCLKCISLRSNKYRMENPQLCKKQWADWYLENKEEFKEYVKEWAKRNPDKIKTYRLKSRSYDLEKKKTYRQKNKERIRASIKKWELKNPEKVKAIQVKQRAMRKKAIGRFYGEEIKELFIKQKGVCAICMVQHITLEKKKTNTLHCDHIIPVSRGGSNYISNIQLACAKCNRRKGKKLMEEFKKELEVEKV